MAPVNDRWRTIFWYVAGGLSVEFVLGFFGWHPPVAPPAETQVCVFRQGGGMDCGSVEQLTCSGLVGGVTHRWYPHNGQCFFTAGKEAER